MAAHEKAVNLDSGSLQEAANHATNAFGHGRLRLDNGDFVDFEPCGMTRGLLDNFVPPVVLCSDDEEARSWAVRMGRCATQQDCDACMMSHMERPFL